MSEVRTETKPSILTTGVGVLGVNSTTRTVGVAVVVAVSAGVGVGLLYPIIVGVNVKVGVGRVGVIVGVFVEASGVGALVGAPVRLSEMEQAVSANKQNKAAFIFLIIGLFLNHWVRMAGLSTCTARF